MAGSSKKRTTKSSARKDSAGDVDAYFAKLPADQRGALDKLRKTIRARVPQATEKISYGIPTFQYRGGLVGLGATARHCTFYLMSTAVMRTHAADLEGHETGKGSIRFTASRPLPAALVDKLVRARIAENEALEKARSRPARKR